VDGDSGREGSDGCCHKGNAVKGSSRGLKSRALIRLQFTSNYYSGDGPKTIKSNYTGNNTKSMFISVEASLKKLKTSYIDIVSSFQRPVPWKTYVDQVEQLYLHWWDHTASIEEVMRSLNTLADQGKILCLGVSDTPAWIVSKANQYARHHGLRQFVVYQGRWSASNRDFERDIIPMCEAEGMGIAPWGALGSGNYKTEEQRQNSEGRNLPDAPEADVAVSKVLASMAEEKDTAMTSVAYDTSS
jgi:aryl-alcohol dehydrogenase-like predicted oxidoreductase